MCIIMTLTLPCNLLFCHYLCLLSDGFFNLALPNTLDQTFNEMTDPLHESISPELNNYLHEHFDESNVHLTHRLNHSLSDWKIS